MFLPLRITECLFPALLLLVWASQAGAQMPQFDEYNDQFRQFHMSTAKGSYALQRSQMAKTPAASAQGTVIAYENMEGKLPPQDRQALKHALEHVYIREYKQSIPFFDVVLSHKPRFWPAVQERAEALSYIGKFKDSINGLTLLINEQPSNWYALTLRAYCYFQLKEWNKGIADCTRCIALAPQEPKGYHNRAEAYRMLHRDAEANADEIKASEYQMPLTAKELIGRGQLTEGLKVLNEYIALNPKDPSGYDQRSYLLVALAKYKDAVNDCTKVIELSPPVKPHACSMRAKAYDNLGEYQKAVDDYSVAIKACESLPKHCNCKGKAALLPNLAFMQPYYPQYLKQQAIDYIQLKKFPEALVDCNKLIKLNPRDADYYSLRADVYAAWGKTHAAMDDCTAAMKLNPKSKYLREQAASIAQTTQSAVSTKTAAQTKPIQSK